jgi:hypothetical protein
VFAVWSLAPVSAAEGVDNSESVEICGFMHAALCTTTYATARSPRDAVPWTRIWDEASTSGLEREGITNKLQKAAYSSKIQTPGRVVVRSDQDS